MSATSPKAARAVSGNGTELTVRLDGPQREQRRCTRRAREASDRLVPGRRRWGLAVVRELSVVEVALVDAEVALGQVEEQVRGLVDQLLLGRRVAKGCDQYEAVSV